MRWGSLWLLSVLLSSDQGTFVSSETITVVEDGFADGLMTLLMLAANGGHFDIVESHLDSNSSEVDWDDLKSVSRRKFDVHAEPEANPHGVFELTDHTFEKFVEQRKTVLIFLYASWCHWCAKMLPQFNKAADLLSSQAGVGTLAIAQADAAKWGKLSDAFNVQAYPTVALIMDEVSNAEELPTNLRSSSQIAQWTLTHLETEVSLESPADLKKLLDSHHDQPVLLGLFPSSDAGRREREAFIQESRKLRHVGFGEVKSRAIFESLINDLRLITDDSILRMDQVILLLNPHHKTATDDELGAVIYNKKTVNPAPGADLSLDSVSGKGLFESFVRTYRFPLLPKFTSANAMEIFDDGRMIFALLLPEEQTRSRNSVELIKVFKQLSAIYRSNALFLHADSSDDGGRRLLTVLRVEPDHLPTVRAFHPTDRFRTAEMRKFAPSEESVRASDFSSLRKFVEDALSNNLAPFIRSEPLLTPDEIDSSDPVTRIVGLQFDDLVTSATHDVVVDFYAPWCGHCKTLEPNFRQMARILRRANPSVRVYKIDATANEVGVHLVGYPTIMLFTGTGTHRRSLEYTRGDRSAVDLVRWIKKSSVVGGFDDTLSLDSSLETLDFEAEESKGGKWEVEEL